MDRQAKERAGLAVLGELNTGHAGGAVYGRGRNLWGGHINPLPGIM